MNYCGFDVVAELLEGVLEGFFVVDFLTLGGPSGLIVLEIVLDRWERLVVLLDFLGQDGGRHVAWRILAHLNHPFLASVLRALHVEYSGLVGTVLMEKLDLSHVLREVLQQHSAVDFVPQSLDQSHRHLLVIILVQPVVLHKLREVYQFHVGSLSKSRSKSGLS